MASWTALQLRVGDGVEVHIDRQHVLHARVRRVLGGGAYGVQFEDVSPQMKNVLIKTVGAAMAGYRTQWSLE